MAPPSNSPHQSGLPPSSEFSTAWVNSLSLQQQCELARLLTPRWNHYLERIRALKTDKAGRAIFPSERQHAFLLTDVEHALFGGATRGGKSLALLAAALQYADVPGYNALIIRETLADLMLPDALIPESHLVLSGSDASWNGSEHTWTFPGGSVLKFGYMQHRGQEQRYQGAAAQFWGFDEAGHLDPWQMEFLTTRASKVERLNVPIRFRYSANPGGRAHEWLVQHFVAGAPENGRLFIPSRAVDNPALDKEYLIRLDAMTDPVLRAQMRDGDWNAVDRKGLVCPEWTPEVERACTVEGDRHPAYFVAYCGGDPGGHSKEQARDMFAMVWGHLDFLTGTLVVTDEWGMRHPSTEDVGNAALLIEATRWGPAEPRTQSQRLHSLGLPAAQWSNRRTSGAVVDTFRVTDLDGRLLIDLKKEPYALHFAHTEKTEAVAWERQLRTAIAQGKVHVHRRCKALLKTLKHARFTDTGDFERTEDTGHADYWKALVYMFRKVDWRRNPWPERAPTREEVILQRGTRPPPRGMPPLR
jgi:hypothetical protein